LNSYSKKHFNELKELTEASRQEEDLLQYGSADCRQIEDSGEPLIQDVSSEAEEQIDDYKERLQKKLDDGITTPSMSRILSGGGTIVLSSECQEVGDNFSPNNHRSRNNSSNEKHKKMLSTFNMSLSGVNKVVRKLDMCSVREAPKEVSDLLSSDQTQSEQPPSEFSHQDESEGDIEESDNSGNILDEECNETM
jgi:hypothetical protein